MLLQTYNENYMEEIQKALFQKCFLKAEEIRLIEITKCVTSTEEHENVYHFYGCTYFGEATGERFIVFTDLATAAYYAVDNYIEFKIAEMLTNFRNRVPSDEFAGLDKEVCVGALANTLLDSQFGFNFIPGISKTPYGYLVTNPRTLPVHLKEHMNAVSYIRTDLAAEGMEDTMPLYMFQLTEAF